MAKKKQEEGKLELFNTSNKVFHYPANQIFKFLAALDFFTIMLTNGEVVHYKASDANSFRQWLTDNKAAAKGTL